MEAPLGYRFEHSLSYVSFILNIVQKHWRETYDIRSKVYYGVSFVSDGISCQV